ncbi:MAG: pantetheine-phosphate adenylyltransferase [Clostridiaceae bacterium]|nr:pantetheine-phosphate adenylyltransferase [Clostridiaceae bacterium]
MRTVVIPGSFDPMTCGHVDLIKRASVLFDEIFVVAMINDQKKYTFTPDERLAIMKYDLAGIENVSVEFYGGMLYEYLSQKKACAIVKGIRDPDDTSYEIFMANFNRVHYQGADTILLPPRHGFERISSSYVKERCRKGLSLEGLVTKHTAQMLVKKMEDEKWLEM